MQRKYCIYIDRDLFVSDICNFNVTSPIDSDLAIIYLTEDFNICGHEIFKRIDTNLNIAIDGEEGFLDNEPITGSNYNIAKEWHKRSYELPINLKCFVIDFWSGGCFSKNITGQFNQYMEVLKREDNLEIAEKLCEVV